MSIIELKTVTLSLRNYTSAEVIGIVVHGSNFLIFLEGTVRSDELNLETFFCDSWNVDITLGGCLKLLKPILVSLNSYFVKVPCEHFFRNFMSCFRERGVMSTTR